MGIIYVHISGHILAVLANSIPAQRATDVGDGLVKILEILGVIAALGAVGYFAGRIVPVLVGLGIAGAVGGLVFWVLNMSRVAGIFGLVSVAGFLLAMVGSAISGPG
jgi:hypothetical protein